MGEISELKVALLRSGNYPPSCSLFLPPTTINTLRPLFALIGLGARVCRLDWRRRNTSFYAKPAACGLQPDLAKEAESGSIRHNLGGIDLTGLRADEFERPFLPTSFGLADVVLSLFLL